MTHATAPAAVPATLESAGGAPARTCRSGTTSSRGQHGRKEEVLEGEVHQALGVVQAEDSEPESGDSKISHQEVCPEEIHITDNAIIPLKERVVDEYYDPLTGLLRLIGLRKK